MDIRSKTGSQRSWRSSYICDIYLMCIYSAWSGVMLGSVPTILCWQRTSGLPSSEPVGSGSRCFRPAPALTNRRLGFQALPRQSSPPNSCFQKAVSLPSPRLQSKDSLSPSNDCSSPAPGTGSVPFGSLGVLVPFFPPEATTQNPNLTWQTYENNILTEDHGEAVASPGVVGTDAVGKRAEPDGGGFLNTEDGGHQEAVTVLIQGTKMMNKMEF